MNAALCSLATWNPQCITCLEMLAVCYTGICQIRPFTTEISLFNFAQVWFSSYPNSWAIILLNEKSPRIPIFQNRFNQHIYIFLILFHMNFFFFWHLKTQLLFFFSSAFSSNLLVYSWMCLLIPWCAFVCACVSEEVNSLIASKKPRA